MNAILETIENCPVISDDARNLLSFLAVGRIDSDGKVRPPTTDPWYQAQTTLRNVDGTYLDANFDRYIVLPPQVIRDVPGIVLGSLALVINTRTLKWCWAVVGDVGPTVRLGEMSIATATAIGLPPSPTTGGVDDDHVIQYLIWPGKAAVLSWPNGMSKTYPLQTL